MNTKLKVKRFLIQSLAAVGANPFIKNFLTGTIYKGKLKNICTPGLNCYSCPAAAGACPVGALQSVAAGSRFSVSHYILGLLIIIGALIGRAVCGLLCPFGFLQDIIYKLPSPKKSVPRKIDAYLRKIKYFMLILPVLVLPALLNDKYGVSKPFFCKYFCPAGTIEAGIPLVIANHDLRSAAGAIFLIKLFIAVLILILAIIICRPFCKYFCPLGAFYSLFNGIAPLKMQLDTDKCVHCGACEHSCPMNVEVTKNINGAECIRCGKCIDACHKNAIKYSLTGKNENTQIQ